MKQVLFFSLREGILLKKEANDPGFTNGTNGRDLSVFYCDSCNVTRRLTRIRRQSGCPSRAALERDLPSQFMDSNIRVKYRHLSPSSLRVRGECEDCIRYVKTHDEVV